MLFLLVNEAEQASLRLIPYPHMINFWVAEQWKFLQLRPRGSFRLADLGGPFGQRCELVMIRFEPPCRWCSCIVLGMEAALRYYASLVAVPRSRVAWVVGNLAAPARWGT